jgi:surfactin family lipopeptide synthetase A
MVIGAPIANHHDMDSESIVGFFLNMLPLRIDLPGDSKFTDLLGYVRETVTDALSNSDYPFIWMLEEADAVRNTSFAPVFQVMFNMLSFPHVSLKYDGLEVAFRELETGYTKYDLTFYAQEQDDRIYLQISYLTELFDDETIDRMLLNLEVLLRSIADRPAARISELDLLHPSERRALLVDFNLTDKEYVGTSSVQELFERQAAATPERAALIFEGRELSYGELNTRANRLAHYLRRAGVGAESLVAVCVERSFDMLVGLLAVVKAGGAYVPLDPTHPPARLDEMLEDASPGVLLLQRHLDRFSRYEGRKVCIDDWPLFADEACSNPAPVTTPDNLFYVVYTSSTTGKAKGTLISMRSVLNRFFWMWDAYPFRDGDVAVLQKSYALVAAAWECFGALLKGVPTVIVSRETLLNPPELWRELVGRGVSYLLASPPLLEGLLEQAREHPGEWKTLRLVTTGAEPVPPEIARRWNQSFPQTSLLNLYGSTECSSNATVYDTKGMADGAARVPIGRPLSNVKAYVLNEYLRPAPLGAVGELHLAGVCLARGYLNLPELTAERFVANEFSLQASSRLYRTGDLARFLGDGNIELLGRKDDQVKVRGFRVELNDIVTALSKHEAVRRCAVLLREAADGRGHLVAYVEAERPLAVSALRSFAREMLPDYMVPTHFLFLEALPLTDNGKVDRRALLKLRLPEQESDGFVPPRTPYEELLAEIWSQTLGVQRVGAHDNFFDLGGHSLLAVQIVARVRDRLQVEVPLRDLYEKPTLCTMADAVERACRNRPLIAAAGPQEQGGGSEEVVEWEEGVL